MPLSLLFTVFNDGIKVMQPSVKSKEKSNNHLVAEEGSRRSSICKLHFLLDKKIVLKVFIGCGVKEWHQYGSIMLPSCRLFSAPVKEDDSRNASPLSDDDAPVSKTQELETDVELDLSCCILMLDILLKQV